MFDETATAPGAQDGQPAWADALAGLSASDSWAETGVALPDGDVPQCSCPLCSGREQGFSEGEPLPDGPTSGLPPSLTLSQIITQLRTSWGGSFENDTYPVYGSSISYAILTSAPNDSSSENSGWQAMSALMAARAAEAFEAWDDLIAINLNPYSGNPPAGASVIQFGYSTATQNGGTYERPELGYYNGTNEFGGDAWSITRSEIWLNSSWSTHSTSSAINQSGYGYYGGYGLITYLHEIGHALGLSHPGSYNAGSGTPTYANSAEYLEDTRRYSIMSYWNAYEDGSGTDHWGSDGLLKYAQTPMVHDIAAVQLLYGADPATRTGNTTYGFNSTAGKDVYDFTKNLNPILSIYDAAGTDTLDLSGFSGTQRIDLAPGAYSDVGGYMTNNLGIAYTATIENAIGGSGADSIAGNSVANVLRGGGGNDSLSGMDGNDTLYGDAGSDILIGGNGTDTAVYSGNFSQYTFRWTGSAYTITDTRGGAPDGVDTVSQMETYQFADRTATSITHDGSGWLTSAKGSTWGMFWDPSNVQGWSSYTESYNGDGVTRLSQIGLYDNGTGWGNFWDPTNVANFTFYQEHYVVGGARDAQGGTYDDGTGWAIYWDVNGTNNWVSYQEQFVAGGAKSAEGGTYDDGRGWAKYWDPTGANNWSFYQEQLNTAAQKTGEGGTYDDGRGWNKYWDPTNENNWSFYQEQLNTNSQVTAEGGTYDDGRGWAKYWDPTNENNWSFIQEQYNTFGEKTAEGGVYDDLRSWSKFWDPRDTQAWERYEEYFNASGQLTGRTWYWDDGTTTTENGPGSGSAPQAGDGQAMPEPEAGPPPTGELVLGTSDGDYWLV